MNREKTIQQVNTRIGNIRGALVRDGANDADVAQSIFYEAIRIAVMEWGMERDAVLTAVAGAYDALTEITSEGAIVNANLSVDQIHEELTADLDEGSTCPACGEGKMHLPPVENCSCHIAPPCAACTTNPLRCDICGWERESEA